MYDLAVSEQLGDLLTQAAAAGKLIAAVCHGPAGLLPGKGPDGRPLVAGRRVTGFTDSEEAAVGKDKIMPFSLEARLRDAGADFARAPDWAECVVRDGNLITGQNPGSAVGLARELLAALGEARAGGAAAGGGVTYTAGELGLVGKGQ
ncbi:HSP31 [Scenedesmus sp. PABB004]|nr:HSP31 [Scenedesmus sp. PABB004]